MKQDRKSYPIIFPMIPPPPESSSPASTSSAESESSVSSTCVRRVKTCRVSSVRVPSSQDTGTYLKPSPAPVTEPCQQESEVTTDAESDSRVSPLPSSPAFAEEHSLTLILSETSLVTGPYQQED